MRPTDEGGENGREVKEQSRTLAMTITKHPKTGFCPPVKQLFTFRDIPRLFHVALVLSFLPVKASFQTTSPLTSHSRTCVRFQDQIQRLRKILSCKICGSGYQGLRRGRRGKNCQGSNSRSNHMTVCLYSVYSYSLPLCGVCRWRYPDGKRATHNFHHISFNLEAVTDSLSFVDCRRNHELESKQEERKTFA